MLQLEFAPELDPVRKAMAEQQHESMEVGPERVAAVLIEMQVHVAGDRKPRFTVARSLEVPRDRNRLNRRDRLRRCGWGGSAWSFFRRGQDVQFLFQRFHARA